MRRDTDHDGIKAWLKDYSTNGISLDGEYCDDIINIFEEEYLQGMLLDYSCQLSCPEGSDPWYIYSDDTKEKHLKLKLKQLGRDEFSDEEKEQYALKDVLLNGEDSLKMECRNELRTIESFSTKSLKFIYGFILKFCILWFFLN